jgi:hypothetical protein
MPVKSCASLLTKSVKLLFLLLFIPVFLFAQELTGVWTGTLRNDSTKKTQQYELALSEYRGKVTGYSYTTFISNDTFYYSIKQMKATRQDSVWIVEDDKMIVNNFPERRAKGVRQINTFRLNKIDSSWKMDGTWKTTQTKKYYSLSGKMEMKVEDDIKKSNLIAHLEELKIENTVVFYQPEKKAPREIKKSEPVVVKTSEPQKILVNVPERIPERVVAKVEPPKKEIVIPKKEEPIFATVTPQKNPAIVPEKKETTPIKTAALPQEKKEIVISQPVKKSEVIPPPVQKQLPKKTEPILVKNEVVTVKPILQPQPQKKTELETKALPVAVSTRKNETIQSIYFTSDSLLLSLYDNGVVDGDTVSVYLNGQVIIDRQMLKVVATKKTIYVPAGTDSLQLVLFAENLGSIPPNTGLLVVHDGEETYQVRFSADMQKNAAVIFRRKQ